MNDNKTQSAETAKNDPGKFSIKASNIGTKYKIKTICRLTEYKFLRFIR